MRIIWNKYVVLLVILSIISMPCISQNGYGPPVYKQDFGIGDANPATLGPALPASKTSFLYTDSLCPSPGSYTILRRTPTSGCFNGLWIDLGHDNNPAISYGMMMLVNNTATAT